ncbi:MAG: bioA, partial [Sediminibacterium sp.]|nr:bioA [Sediminibacterium sp.]
CTARVYGAYVNDDNRKTFFHGHSFTANPLACTAALASLDLLQKDECLQKMEWITEENRQFAEKLRAGIWKCKHIRTQGTILAFEMDHGPDEYLNTISTRFTSMAMAKGVYIRPLGNTVYIMPPYCITEEELQKTYEVILSVLTLL